MRCMMVEIYLMEQLAAFAKYGTLSRAAEELHISQPALSRSMKKKPTTPTISPAGARIRRSTPPSSTPCAARLSADNGMPLAFFAYYPNVRLQFPPSLC